MHAMRCFLSSQDGSAAIETSLLTSLLGAALVTSLSGLGEQLAAVFNYISAVLAQAIQY